MNFKSIQNYSKLPISLMYHLKIVNFFILTEWSTIRKPPYYICRHRNDIIIGELPANGLI